MLSNENGFTLVESLMGFFMFSIILALYIPSFYQEYALMQSHIELSNKWLLFQQSILVTQSQEYSQNETLLESVYQEAESLGNQINSFNCIELGCKIQFADEESYEIWLDN